MIPHPWSSGVESTPAIRGHFYSHSNEEKPLPAAALLTFCFARIEARWGGDLLDKRFMNPSAMPVCYLFYRRVYTRGSQKMRGWYVHANDSQREILKKGATLVLLRIESIIPRARAPRQLFAVINILFVFFLARSAIRPVIQINPGETNVFENFPINQPPFGPRASRIHSDPPRWNYVHRWTRSEARLPVNWHDSQ